MQKQKRITKTCKINPYQLNNTTNRKNFNNTHKNSGACDLMVFFSFPFSFFQKKRGKERKPREKNSSFNKTCFTILASHFLFLSLFAILNFSSNELHAVAGLRGMGRCKGTQGGNSESPLTFPCEKQINNTCKFLQNISLLLHSSCVFNSLCKLTRTKKRGANTPLLFFQQT